MSLGVTQLRQIIVGGALSDESRRHTFETFAHKINTLNIFGGNLLVDHARACDVKEPFRLEATECSRAGRRLRLRERAISNSTR